MRRWLVCALAPVTACLFPSLDGLGGGDAGSDVTSVPDVNVPDVADVVAPPPDASDGGCPPNADPTLLGYWQLDEGTGEIVKDCSGNGFDGLVLSPPDAGSWAQGHSGSAIRVDGVGGCIEIGAPSKLVLTQAVTAMAWVNVEQYVSVGYIVGKSTNANLIGWRIATDTNADLIFDVPWNDLDAGNGGPHVGIGSQPTGTWVHVAATFAAKDTIKLYINGAQASTASVTTAIIDDSQATVRIGCRSDSSSFFVGLIDEVRIYGRALSPAEIAAIAVQ